MRKRVKKDDIKLTPIKSDTFASKALLNINQPLLSSSSLINSADKKTKPAPSMFDTIFSGSNDSSFKLKDDTSSFQLQLDQVRKKIVKFKHKVQHFMTLIRTSHRYSAHLQQVIFA